MNSDRQHDLEHEARTAVFRREASDGIKSRTVIIDLSDKLALRVVL